MVSVRKRGKVYEYRFSTTSIDGIRKWLTKSGVKTRQEVLQQGADIKTVSKRLGHSTIQIMYNIYVRVTSKMETDTIDRFENYTNSLNIPNNEDILFKD